MPGQCPAHPLFFRGMKKDRRSGLSYSDYFLMMSAMNTRSPEAAQFSMPWPSPSGQKVGADGKLHFFAIVVVEGLALQNMIGLGIAMVLMAADGTAWADRYLGKHIAFAVELRFAEQMLNLISPLPLALFFAWTILPVSTAINQLFPGLFAEGFRQKAIVLIYRYTLFSIQMGFLFSMGNLRFF